ncbi:MAG: hypothetical protein HKN36_03750 [Hellea sp.]|nr:hypothetical protein [Hellea sp.]
MRLAACALSAVLLSGCSWLGSGGGYNDSNSYGYNGVFNGCAPSAGGAAFANSSYGYASQGAMTGHSAGCAPGQGYNVAHGGAYGQGMGHGMSQGMHGMHGQGMQGGKAGLRGPHGVNAYGTGLQGGHVSGMYGAGSGMYAGGSGVTTLSGAAPYGSAVGGMGSMMSMQQGANVKTVQGAPIYVPQPYAAYYNAGGYNAGGYYAGSGYSYGGAMPFGLELDAGTELALDGDIFPGETSKPFLGGPGTVSDMDSVSYEGAWDAAKAVGVSATYDVNQNTTLLGRVGYSKADGGNQILVGTVDDGAGLTEDLYAEFSDLKQYTVEGGVRHYMGNPAGMRPYVGATAGFVKTEDVTLTQSSDTLVDPALFQQTYVDGGWSPTAAGLVGAEWAMGGRGAIGVETGIRWTDDLDTNYVSDSRVTVPVRLRGRVAF